jgi:hypothetical protein
MCKDESCVKIQRWWKKYTTIGLLKSVYTILLDTFANTNDLQDLSNKFHAIITKCVGDGAGLSSGTIIDMLLCEFMKNKIPQYVERHDGESDMTINGIPLSLKKINGKSSVALNWSKNTSNKKQEHFTCSIMIINLKTEKWWKNNPNTTHSKIKTIYNETIPSGIYFVDKQFCKYYVQLSCNNKTNTLIESKNLYIMLKRSIALHLFIHLPLPNQNIEFNLLKAFETNPC